MNTKAMSKGKASMTLNRKGSFTIHVADNAPHCGITSNGTVGLNYDLTVVCGKDSLDSRGFLFNQAEFDAWLQRVGNATAIAPVKVSCEVYTRELARLAFRQIKKENPRCDVLSIRLTLAPSALASMTFEWSK